MRRLLQTQRACSFARDSRFHPSIYASIHLFISSQGNHLILLLAFKLTSEIQPCTTNQSTTGNYDTWIRCYDSDAQETRSSESVREVSNEQVEALMRRRCATKDQISVRDVLAEHVGHSIENTSCSSGDGVTYGSDVVGVADVNFDSKDDISFQGDADVDVSMGLFSWPVPRLVSYSNAGIAVAARMQTLAAKAGLAAAKRAAKASKSSTGGGGGRAQRGDEEDVADVFVESGGSFQTWCALGEDPTTTAVSLVLGVGDQGDLLVPMTTRAQSIAKQAWTVSRAGDTTSDGQIPPSSSGAELSMRLVEPRVSEEEALGVLVVSALRCAKVTRDAAYCYSEDVTEWLTPSHDRMGVWHFTPRTPGCFLVRINDTTFRVYVHGKTNTRSLSATVDPTAMTTSAGVATGQTDTTDVGSLLVNNLGVVCVKPSHLARALALRSVEARLDVTPGQEGMTLNVHVSGASERCVVHVVAGRLISPGSALGQGT
jgi:hypothetical protein